MSETVSAQLATARYDALSDDAMMRVRAAMPEDLAVGNFGDLMAVISGASTAILDVCHEKTRLPGLAVRSDSLALTLFSEAIDKRRDGKPPQPGGFSRGDFGLETEMPHEWFPIDTLPDDPGAVLIAGWEYNGGPDPETEWLWECVVAWQEDGEWIVDICVTSNEYIATTIDEIVAWAPCPKAPAWAKRPPSRRKAK